MLYCIFCRRRFEQHYEECFKESLLILMMLNPAVNNIPNQHLVSGPNRPARCFCLVGSFSRRKQCRDSMCLYFHMLFIILSHFDHYVSHFIHYMSPFIHHFVTFYLRNRSALAVNCCVIINCLEVSCKEDQIKIAARVIYLRTTGQHCSRT